MTARRLCRTSANKAVRRALLGTDVNKYSPFNPTSDELEELLETTRFKNVQLITKKRIYGSAQMPINRQKVMAQKFFQKILKKRLTNPKRCDIIIKSSAVMLM